MHELHKLVPEKNIFVDGEVHQANWRAFKEEYKFTSASMAALIREAREDFLRSKLVRGGKNRELPEHTARAFANFVKEKRIITFEGGTHFNLVTMEPLKIQGWLRVEPRKAIRMKANNHFPFALIDFRNIPGSSFEGTMSTMFHEQFMAKFVDYASPKLREIDIWQWIVEHRRAEQVYEIVRKLQLEYVVSKSHYIAAPAEGAYSTLTDKKNQGRQRVVFVLRVQGGVSQDAEPPYNADGEDISGSRRVGKQQMHVRRGEIRQLSLK